MKPLRRPAQQLALGPPRNRHLRRHSHFAGHGASSAVPSRWDSWLSRGASISQIVGIGLALAGLFYTVIPLYQKAAVDEQLARREAELKAVENSLAEARTETYRLRRDNYLRVAARAASDECSDVRRSFMPIPESIGNTERRYRLQLDVNVVDCVKRYLARADEVKELSPADLEVWRAWATPLAMELETQRQAARQKVGDMPQLAAADPSVLEPLGDFARRTEDFLSRYDALRTPEQRLERQRRFFDQRVESTQSSIAASYRQQVSLRLLRELEPKVWREERQKREESMRPSAPASAASA